MSRVHSAEPVIAGVRFYTAPPGGAAPAQPRLRTIEGWPPFVLLLDTETTPDASQRLRLGSYRFCEWQRDKGGQWRLVCLEEGLFCGEDLPTRAPNDFQTLKNCVLHATADTPGTPGARLPLYSRTELVNKVLYKAGLVGRALIVGFNLPFDLSRLAVAATEARGKGTSKRFVRGFSFVVWAKEDTTSGAWAANAVRPWLRIKHRDNKSADIEFTTAKAEELWSGTGANRRCYKGRFLDLKTFAFALLGTSHTLKSLAEAVGAPSKKGGGDHNGPITAEYVDYNRQDLRVSLDILEALRQEFDRHPIAAEPWRLRSPASLAKAYFRAAGISPLASRTPALPPAAYGVPMNAYFGGRSEYHIPRMPVPVVYADFLSMYPTVQALANLREWLAADHFRWQDITGEARDILNGVTLEALLDPASWPRLRFFAQVIPNGDILPLRAQYHPHNDGFGIAVTRVTGPAPLWYSGFDLAASVLLTGKVPRLVQAFSLEPVGTLKSLRPVALRGRVTIAPRKDDIFRAMVEMRHQVKRDATIPKEERESLAMVLKTVANSGSYGVFAEMNPQDLSEGKTRKVQILDGGDVYPQSSNKPEEPGEYCFPAMAATITAAARLLLALLERLISDKGGSYAFCDTDSMAIVATEKGGFFACPGGTRTAADGTCGIHALSWANIRAIVDRIQALNPYGTAVSDTLLKIESENFDGAHQIQLYSYGISAKRYCLFRKLPNNELDILKASEHGLGQLLNPMDLEDRERGTSGAARWIEDIWRNLVGNALGLPAIEQPDWFSRPAVARHGYSSPVLLRPRHRQEKALSYFDQAKPFNFGLTCYVTFDGAPAGTDAATCHLVGAYEPDPGKWLTQSWFDTSSSVECGISTERPMSDRVAQVKSVADVIREYAAHAESKSAAPDGCPAISSTVGLLSRRHVAPVHLHRLGKETNKLEEVAQGQIRRLSDVQEIVEDPSGSEWEAVFLPRLKRAYVKDLAGETGIAESLLHRYRKGTTRPGRRRRGALATFLRGE